MKVFEELSVFNRVTFVEKTHSYLVDGTPTNRPSVTRLLKNYKKQFDKEKTALRTAKKQKTTVAHVLAEWEMNNLYSTTLGSMLHKYIENFYNDNKHIVCVKNEMVLGDIDDTKVCGMMDMLSYNTKTKCFEILDFKTNKKMDKISPWGNLFYPFDDMTEGEINEYTIQLNCYKYFIEKHTSLNIDKLKLVWFNVINEDYKVIELEDIQPKIKNMFNHYSSSSLFGVV